jgi:Tfp pilus assembly protein PilX
MMPTIHRRSHSPAFALISTLLVLTILTVMAVVFLQSMRTDRLTSRAYLNKLKADTMAEAAQQAAISKILQAIPSGTNAAKGFVTWGYSNNNDFRPFYVAISRDILNGDFTNTSGTAPNTYWLVSSSGSSQPTIPDIADPNKIMSGYNDKPQNYADMNAGKQIDPNGTAYPAGWIYLSGNAANTGGTYGRYAYWVDDESSKLDVSRTGNTNNTVTTSATYTPTVAQPNDPNAPLDATNLKIEGLSNNDVNTLVSYRSGTAWPSPSSPAQTVPALSGATNQNLYTVDIVREETVQNTGAYPDPQNLIAYGPKVGEARMNLNVIATTPATLASATTAVTQIHQFIQSGLPDYYTRKETAIGPAGTVNRIAASIVNYIRPESYPLLSPNLQGVFNNNPPSAWPNYTTTNTYYGIAAAPRINEILTYYGPASSASPQYSVTGPGGGAYPYQVSMGLTRTIELWNCNDKAITYPNLYVHLFNQQAYPVPGAFNSIPDLASEDLALTTSSITLQANAFQAFPISKVYTVNAATSSSFDKTRLPNAFGCGILLFYIEGGNPLISNGVLALNGGAIRVLDGYYPFKLQGNAGTIANPSSWGKAGSSPGYSTSGNSADIRLNLGRFLNRWETNTAEAHTPGAANNSTYQSRAYQDMTTWFDRPRTGGVLNCSPLSAPAHIANQPMQNIIELGNILDPGNDTRTDDGPRGTKTLVIGQFDSFVTPRNYPNYLKTADAALLEIFTIDNGNDRYRLNVNVPRPGTLANPPAAGPYTSLNPLQTFWSFLRNQYLTSYPTGVTRPLISDNPINDSLIKRLVASDRTRAMPFRNFNDFVLLGYTRDQLVSANAAPNYNFDLIDSANTSNPVLSLPSVWAKSSSPLYNSNTPLTSVTLNGSQTARIDGNDRLREEAFGRVAHLITFRSYRYRIYSQGQALDQNGRVLARTAKSCLIDLIPNLPPGSSGTPANPNQITYNVKITPVP